MWSAGSFAEGKSALEVDARSSCGGAADVLTRLVNHHPNSRINELLALSLRGLRTALTMISNFRAPLSPPRLSLLHGFSCSRAQAASA